MAVATGKRERDVVYPEDRLPWPQTILMGLQHVMAMFGATVLVPLILGFNPNTVIFFSGVATLIFLFVTGFKVPSYLGSSFSFIGSVLAVQGTQNPNHGLAYAGIVMAGVIYLIIGAIVHVVGVPSFSFPDFSQFGTELSLFFFIPVILVAENAGHVYAISGIMKRDLSHMLGRTFIGDGLGTTISGLLGGTGETTYAENIGVMGITRVFSIMVFVVAAVFAILLGFIPMFGALVRSIPVSVQGGIEMYLFGLIAVIGGKIWVDARVDFSKRANLAVAAIPLVIAAGIPATQAIPIHLGGLTLTFNNLGLGALSAIVLYQLLRPGHVRDKDSEPAEVVATE